MELQEAAHSAIHWEIFKTHFTVMHAGCILQTCSVSSGKFLHCYRSSHTTHSWPGSSNNTDETYDNTDFVSKPSHAADCDRVELRIWGNEEETAGESDHEMLSNSLSK